MKKRMLSILLAIMMIIPLFTINIGSVEASDLVSAPVNQASESTKTGIDYSAADIIVTGSINNGSNSGYFINLNKETFTVPADYQIAAYSTNGGTSWTAVTAAKPFNNAKLVDLLASNVTLAFTDKYETNKKRTPEDAVIVKFPKINKRPSLLSGSYTVNYEIGADNTGMTTGTWLLTEKNGKTSVKQGLEIGVLNSAGKLDENGYGRFYGLNGSTNGIEIAFLSANGKAVSPSYNIRKAPALGSDGTYTAASKSVKITVDGQRAVPAYTVDTKKKTITYPANTYIFKDKNIELQAKKGTVDIANYNGDIYLWSAATSRTPTISAMRKVSVTTAADGTFAYTTDTVTVLTEAILNAPAGEYTKPMTNNPPINATSGEVAPPVNKAQSVMQSNMGITPMAAQTPISLVVTNPPNPYTINAPAAFVTSATGTITWTIAPSTQSIISGTVFPDIGNSISITAATPGTVTVTATLTGDAAITDNIATWDVIVTQPVSSVTINQQGPVELKRTTTNPTTTLSVDVQPQNASNKAVTWSSDNPTVVSVGATTGVVTGLAKGTATITATANDGSGKTDSITVNVTQLVTGITITRGTPSPAHFTLTSPILIETDKATLGVTVTPNNPTDDTVTWSSSAIAVATVNNNGVISAVAPGKATITVTADDGSGSKASIDITIVPDGTLMITASGNPPTLTTGQVADWTVQWLSINSGNTPPPKPNTIDWATNTSGGSGNPNGITSSGTIPTTGTGTMNVSVSGASVGTHTVVPSYSNGARLPVVVNGTLYNDGINGGVGFPLNVMGATPADRIRIEETAKTPTILSNGRFVGDKNAAFGIICEAFKVGETTPLNGITWKLNVDTTPPVGWNFSFNSNLLTASPTTGWEGMITVFAYDTTGAEVGSDIISVKIWDMREIKFAVSTAGGGEVSASDGVGPTVGPTTSSKDITAREDRTVTFTALPKEGYRVKQWQMRVGDSGSWTDILNEDKNGNPIAGDYNKTNEWPLSYGGWKGVPSGIINVQVEFEKIPVYSVTLDPGGSGELKTTNAMVAGVGGTSTATMQWPSFKSTEIFRELSTAGTIEVLPNNSVRLVATPAAGWEISDWTVEYKGTPPTGLSQTIPLTAQIVNADGSVQRDIPASALPIGTGYPTNGNYGEIVVKVTFVKTLVYEIHYSVNRITGNETGGTLTASQGTPLTDNAAGTNLPAALTTSGTGLNKISVSPGTSIKFTADGVPPTGYRIKSWTVKDIPSIADDTWERGDADFPDDVYQFSLPSLAGVKVAPSIIEIIVTFEPIIYYDVTFKVKDPKMGTIEIAQGSLPTGGTEITQWNATGNAGLVKLPLGSTISFDAMGLTTPAPGYQVKNWTVTGSDVTGVTGGANGLRYTLTLPNAPPTGITGNVKLTVEVEFERVPLQIERSVPLPGEVVKLYSHTFNAISILPDVKWDVELIGYDNGYIYYENTNSNWASRPSGVDNIFTIPVNSNNAKQATLTGTVPKELRGRYYFKVTAYNPSGTSTDKNEYEFSIYFAGLYDIEYQIDKDGVNGKLFIQVGSEAEKEYDGRPGTIDAMRSKTNIPENTPVIFKAVPTDHNLYMPVWKVIDKSIYNNELKGINNPTSAQIAAARTKATIVDTEINPSIIDYGQFNDDRTVFTVSQLNKDIEVTVSFKSMPEYRVEFYAVDKGKEDSPGATGGAVSAVAHDRVPPRTLFEGLGEQNRVRGGSDVEFTAHEGTGWTVLEWRVYELLLDSSGNVVGVGNDSVEGYGSTYKNKLTRNIRVVLVFTRESTVPVTSVTVNPEAISIGETGNGTITANVAPQTANQRVNWNISYTGGVNALITALANKLGITDLSNFKLNEIKNQAGDIIAYSYQTRSKASEPWDSSQEIIRIEPDSAQGVKVTVGDPTKDKEYGNYGNYEGLRFSVTATSAVNPGKKSDPSTIVTITKYIAATKVDLQPKTLTMVVGGDETLKATVHPTSPPEPLGASNKDVTWSSSDSNIVFVDSDGKATALNKGTATITVKTVDGNFTDICVITVIEAFIELDKPNNYTFAAKTLDYTDAGTHTVRITNKATEPVNVTVKLEGPHKDAFEVSPTLFENMPANSFNMFTVKPNLNLPVGIYTAIVVVEGKSVATGKSVGTLKFEVSFRVVKDATEIPPSQSIKITVLSSPRPPVTQNGKTTYILYVGETLNVKADKIYPENPDAEINWKVVDTIGIVELQNSIGETNVITAKALGTATVEARYNPYDYIYITVAGRPQIILPDEVTNLPDYGVQVPGGSLSQAHLPNAIIGTPYNQTLLTVGFTGYYSATSGTSSTSTGSPPLYWRVSGGLLPPGLTLTQWIDGTTATLGANHQAGSVIEGTPTAAGSGKLYTFTLEAGEIVYYAQGTSVIWRAPDGGGYGFSLACVNDSTLCNHPTVITNPITGARTVNNACSRFQRVVLSGNRVVLFAPQATAVRTMNIYVRTESYFVATGLRITASGMTNATVNVNGVNVTEKRLSMAAGTTSTVTPVISPTNATVKNVIYESSNTTVATIDSSGKINAKEAGTALISVTTIDGNLSDTILVTVTKVNVTGISLNTQRITVGVGGTATLTATIKPSNASVKDVIWTTSDASIVSVDSTGKITGIKPTGTTPVTISASSADNPNLAAATVQVTVSPLAVTGVNLKEETTLGIGDTETLLATVLPANASDKNVEWSSSDTAVATVDNAGVITGIAAGKATITAKTKDGSYTATCKVTVANSYNINLNQTAGGTVTMSTKKALSGAKVNLSVSPNSGYYLVGWETSPVNIAITAGSFTMPAQNITITPIFKQFTFMNEYIQPLNLDTTKPSYSFKFTSAIGNNSLGISIRASELAELARRNPNFTIDIDTAYGIYQFPVNILSIIPDINGILSRNNVNVNEVVFNITITDKSNDMNILNAVAQSNIIGSPVDFTVEIARIDASGRPGNRIAVVNNFTEKITRLIPLNPNAAPTGQQWGAYKYIPETNQFEFVPHITRNIEGQWYVAIMSNTNSIYVVAKNPVGFSDVAANQWYTPYIAKAAAKRLVQGMGGGLYQPDANVTRAQFVQMIANAMQLPNGTSTPYSDVKTTDWFYSAITRARSAGLLNKFPNSTFNPNQPITRGEMTVILAAALRKYGFVPNDESIRRFQLDFIDSVSPDNLGDAALVYSLGIMNGIGNNYYSPGGYTTRAQAATVQIRLLETLGFIDK